MRSRVSALAEFDDAEVVFIFMQPPGANTANPSNAMNAPRQRADSTLKVDRIRASSEGVAMVSVVSENQARLRFGIQRPDRPLDLRIHHLAIVARERPVRLHIDHSF